MPERTVLVQSLLAAVLLARSQRALEGAKLLLAPRLSVACTAPAGGTGSAVAGVGRTCVEAVGPGFQTPHRLRVLTHGPLCGPVMSRGPQPSAWTPCWVPQNDCFLFPCAVCGAQWPRLLDSALVLTLNSLPVACTQWFRLTPQSVDPDSSPRTASGNGQQLWCPVLLSNSLLSRCHVVRPSLGGISVLLVRGPELGGTWAACLAQCPVALTHVSPGARSEAHGQVLSIVLVFVGWR